MSNRAHADEDQYGILGEYVAVPAVMVEVLDGTQSLPDNPCVMFGVKVTVRSSSEQSTVATHNLNASTVGDVLWDPAAINEAIDDSAKLAISGHNHDGQSFNRTGRALVTEFSMQFEVTSKG
jgi:uncharacterized membrane protein